MNPVAIRLLNQQLIAQQYSNPAEVVRYMCAMQAQEYRMMRWAVAMRTRKPSHKAFKQAFDEGQIIRLHLMRGTWQLVCAEDYWSMVALFAPKAIAVTKGWMSSNKICIGIVPTTTAVIFSLSLPMMAPSAATGRLIRKSVRWSFSMEIIFRRTRRRRG